MWSRVESVIEDVRPLIKSVGMDVAVEDVLDQVVTLKLLRVDDTAQPDMARLREFVTREVKSEIKLVESVVFLDPAPAPQKPSWAISEPSTDSDTVVINFEADVAPTSTSLFETAADAADWPVIASVLAVSGIETVLGRGPMLVAARADDAGWDRILADLDSALGARTGPPAATGDLTARVHEVLERDINPGVASHGGRIELVRMNGTEAQIRMTGGCQGCAQSTATLRMGVEQALLQHVPEVTRVTDVTDHSSGTNPFFHR